MGRPSNHRIKTRLLNVEVHIESVENGKWDIAEHIVDHLYVSVASGDIPRRLRTYLHSCGIKRRILILVRTYQHHVFEPGKPVVVRQLIQHAIFEIFLVGHSHLRQRYRLFPLVHDPHTCRKKTTCFVKVPEMWST